MTSPDRPGASTKGTGSPEAAYSELIPAWRIPVEHGFSVFPVELRGKRPLGRWKQYQTERATLGQVRKWAARPSNIGIVTGSVSGIVVLDLDSIEAIEEAKLRGIPETAMVRTAKGLHIYFQHPGGYIGNRAGIFAGADLRGDGGYVVAPGSVHESGFVYVWENPPDIFPSSPIPAWLLDLLAKPGLPDNVVQLPVENSHAISWAKAELYSELAVVRGAQHGTRNNTLNIAAMKLGQIVAGGYLAAGDVKQQLRDSALASGLETGEIEATIESGFAKGLTEPRRPSAHGVDADISEHQIATAFTQAYVDQLLFDHHAGRWYEWTGSRWQRNETRIAFHFAREMAVRISGGKGAFCRASVASGVETFCRNDPAHAVTSEVWDRDPWLIGTAGGTVDLRTGELFAARQSDMITRLTGVTPEVGEPKLWLDFLGQTTGGDRELMRFLRQVAGYCLTGLTSEHALLFIYGPGGNGKSVFLNILAFIMGDYAVTSSMDTFTASRGDRHSAELAMLAGARLVTASETEEGRAWAEARIKQLTGGEPITARFMRQDFFTFAPQFKLLIVGNHAPALHNVDEAARRRFNIVPFTRKPEYPDQHLQEKLRGEAGRILSWAIEGCLDWRENGLVRPLVVTAATADYFEDQDTFGHWLEQCCDRSPGKSETAGSLFASWSEFARAAGDNAGSQKALSSRLARAGFRPQRLSGGARAYQGISLRKETCFQNFGVSDLC